MSNETTQKRSLSVSLGAAFLMATSAIGPGFLTQTSQFTAKYLSSFAFVIVCVIIMDMIAQTNVWSIVGVSGLRGQEIANKVLPGLGYLLVVLVVLGGLAFNIGNVGGVSLGFNAMIGIPEKAGVIIGGVLAICIFLSKKANDIVGKVAQILGGIIIVVMLVVAFMAKPPVGDAVVHIFTPENPKELIPVMVTLLGGSCGGYITFSGAHKLLDAGWGGKPEEVKHFRKSVLTGICVSSSVRILLFLCVLGVCTAGTVVVAENVAAVTGAANPAAEAFRLAAGDIGYWKEGYVGFLIGCSFSFEEALMREGIEVRHIAQGRNVPMFKTNIMTEPAGPFCGPMVCSMRPMTPENAKKAYDITMKMPNVHGAPVHMGDAAEVGVADVMKPDYGEAVDFYEGEIPVFWPCGVTPQAAVENAKPPIAITHAPGHMFITDIINSELNDFLEAKKNR